MPKNRISSDADSRLRIIVLGYIVRGPLGGMSLSDLQYLLGLADIGHDVYFVEDSGDYQWCCYDPLKNTMVTDPTYGLRFAAYLFERVGLGDRWAYYDAHTARWLGPCADRILSICMEGDLLLNLGGVNPLRPWLMEMPVRALVDKDPVFTQIRHLTDHAARSLASQHTAFFSFGANISHSRCTIPQDGLPWQETRHPVFLKAWPVTPELQGGRFTTVMQWDSYPPREYSGVCYGMKSDSFGPYLDLPQRADPILELAIGSSLAPRALLRSKGWRVCNPLKPAWTPWQYQQYIRQSKAEFTVAKHGYVISRSGWFSERSAAYLASGRPVVIQETGFSDWLERGAGVMAFNSPDEALADIEEINSRYAFHCRAARIIAAEYFDTRKILPSLIERAMHVIR